MTQHMPVHQNRETSRTSCLCCTSTCSHPSQTLSFFSSNRNFPWMLVYTFATTHRFLLGTPCPILRGKILAVLASMLHQDYQIFTCLQLSLFLFPPVNLTVCCGATAIQHCNLKHQSVNPFLFCVSSLFLLCNLCSFFWS